MIKMPPPLGLSNPVEIQIPTNFFSKTWLSYNFSKRRFHIFPYGIVMIYLNGAILHVHSKRGVHHTFTHLRMRRSLHKLWSDLSPHPTHWMGGVWDVRRLWRCTSSIFHPKSSQLIFRSYILAKTTIAEDSNIEFWILLHHRFQLDDTFVGMILFRRDETRINY